MEDTLMSTSVSIALAIFVQEGLTAIFVSLFSANRCTIRKFSCGDARALQAAMQEAKSLGYASETVQMGVSPLLPISTKHTESAKTGLCRLGRTATARRALW